MGKCVSWLNPKDDKKKFDDAIRNYNIHINNAKNPLKKSKKSITSIKVAKKAAWYDFDGRKKETRRNKQRENRERLRYKYNLPQK